MKAALYARHVVGQPEKPKCLSGGPDGYVCVALKGHAGRCIALGAHGEPLATWSCNQAGIRIQGSECPCRAERCDEL